MTPLSNLLVCGLLQVTLVAAAGLMIVAVSSRWSRNSAARFSFVTLVAIVALTAMAFVPLPSWLDVRNSNDNSALPNSRNASNSSSEDLGQSDAQELTQPVPFGIAEFLSAGVEGLRNLNRTDALISSTSDPTGIAQVPAREVTWRLWFAWLFAAGIVLGLIRLIGGIVGVGLMVRSSRPLRNVRLQEMLDVLSAELSCPVPIELRECQRLATAATVGWRRPVILISGTWKSWSDNQLRSVLAHEIAHIVRQDFASTLAAQMGLAIHFYHPLVHWLVNRLRLEQELVADAMAARAVGGPQTYLSSIGELALLQSKEQVSWPAQSFLPTRRTFLRRIEMLRDMKLLADRAPLALRAGSLISLVAVTMAVAGIRPPGATTIVQVAAAEPAPGTATAVAVSVLQQTAALEARYVPADVLAVAVFRPAEVIDTYQLARSLTEVAMSDAEKAATDQMAKCRFATVVMSIPDRQAGTLGEPFGVMLSFADKSARDAAAQWLTPGNSFRKENLVLAEIEVQGPRARYFPDDTTLIFGGTDTLKSMVLAGPSSLSMLTQSEAWTEATNGTIAVAVNPTGLRTLMADAPPNPIGGMFSAFWMQADSHTLGVTLGDSAHLKLVTASPDEESAKAVEATLNAGLVIVTGMIRNQKATVPAEHRQAVEAFENFLNSKQLLRESNLITLSFKGDGTTLDNTIAQLLMPALTSSRQAAQRAQQMNNFKQIMLAMHNYQDVNGHFPSAVIVDAASGVERSWRVELLPFLASADLYEQYRKDQPWDSDANKAVLEKMPSVFRHPTMPARTTNTSVFAAVGKGLVFEPANHKGTALREITDGTSNTIAIVEANRDIPWTKPQDIEFDLTQDTLPELVITQEGFIVGICDGSVRFLSKKIDVATLKKLLTRAGQEIIEQF